VGTIIGRTRKDGSKAFVAQIVIKKGGAVLHREAETFDRKQAANAWIVKREAELKRPGGLEQKEDPLLAAVIDRYIDESRNPVSGTKAQVLKTSQKAQRGVHLVDLAAYIDKRRAAAIKECHQLTGTA
jgi:hypothetical protein